MAERLVAYEEMWQKEESDLWSWLEDRIGVEELGTPIAAGESSRRPTNSRLSQDSMSDRQMDEAIKVTEERLNDLKKMVEKKRSNSAAAKGKP